MGNKYFIVTAVVILFATFQYEVIAQPPLGIINGTDAEEGEFPYVVQLLDQHSSFKCGGAILGPEWILTAGHCVQANMHSIVYGTNKLHDGDGYTNTTISVKQWFLHPKFEYAYKGGVIYDVGIIKLTEPIPLSSVAQPIKLAEANQDVPFHKQGVLAGWGVNETDGNAEQLLQKIYLQLLTDQECTKKINDFHGEATFLSAHDLCSDDYYNGECFGDSGSPYVINGTQYGLVSWSFNPCGISPGTYSRLTNPEYRDWIKNITINLCESTIL